MSAKHQALRIRMEQELATLGARVQRIEGHLRKAAPADWEEAATERENDEVLEHLDESGLRRVALLRAALGRVHDGSYGRCVTCSDPIPEARLEALPHTPWCVDCAGLAEG
jgi:RNA polymerase-binding transcription factor DksA